MPTCCAAGHSGSIAGPVVLPVKIGPTLPARGAADVLRSRPVADVLPVKIGCRRAARGAADVLLPVNSRPVAPRSRPVTREALPAPWCCPVKIGPTLPARGTADVLRCRPVADVLPVVLPAGQLPAGCPTLPAGHSGKRCRPRGAAGQDRPHAPGPAVLPTCCAAGQLPADCPTLPARGAADVLRCRSTLLYAALPALFRRACGATVSRSALRRRVNRYNPTHLRSFYAISCCFRACLEEVCP